MAQRVPFQKWRIFFWALKQASLSGAHSESNPRLAQAYRELAELGKEALEACYTGKQDVFIQKLDVLQGRSLEEYAKSELERMLDGKHKDLPEWLRK